MSDAAFRVFIIVFGYQTDHQRFWSGRRAVAEYPDAATYTTLRDARTAHGRAVSRLKDQCPVIVKDYGLDSECVVDVVAARSAS